MSPGGAYGGDPHDDAHDNDDYNAHGGDHDDAHDHDDEDDNAHGGDHDDDSSDYFTTADLLGCTRVSRRELSDHINDVDDETNGDVDTEKASYGDDDDYDHYNFPFDSDCISTNNFAFLYQTFTGCILIFQLALYFENRSVILFKLSFTLVYGALCLNI